MLKKYINNYYLYIILFKKINKKIFYLILNILKFKFIQICVNYYHCYLMKQLQLMLLIQ